MAKKHYRSYSEEKCSSTDWKVRQEEFVCRVFCVLATWYCGCLTILMPRRSPLPLCSWQRQQENGVLNFITCSLDVKQAFDNVSQENLSLVMKEMEIAPALAGAILREQKGGKYDMCFRETRISHVPFCKSIKQGGKESPSLFNLMTRSVFHNIARKVADVADVYQDKEQWATTRRR